MLEYRSYVATYRRRIFCCLVAENLSSCRDGWVMNFINRSKYVFHSCDKQAELNS